MLSVLRFTDSDYTFGIFWPLCFLSFFDLRILITSLVSLAIVFSVLRFTDSDYPFGIFWSLCFLSFGLRILITPLVSFGHCVFCPSLVYGFLLPVWYLVAIVLSVLLLFTDSDYTFGIFWPLYCLSFFGLRILITPLVSFGHCIVCPSVYGF